MTRPYSAPLERASYYFPALTGLRAVVALQVFFFHATASLSTEQLPFFIKWVIRILQQGSAGVSIFFVLSGYLISIRYVYSVELKPYWWRSYLQNRLARIYPIYFLLTAFAFLVLLVKPSYNWYQWPASFHILDKIAAIFTNFTLTRAFFNDFVFLGVPTAWSLTVEESFYLCAPFLLISLKKCKYGFFLYPVLFFLLGLFLVFLCTRYFPYYGLMSSITFVVQFTFFGRCIEFIIGIWTAFRFMRLAGNWPALRGKTTLLGGVSLVLILLILSTLKNYGLIVFYTYKFLLPSSVAILIWGLAAERTWLQQLLTTKVFTLLGKSSYIFYLIHLGIIDTLFTHYIADNWAMRLITYTLLSIALYKWIEQPMHEFLRFKPQFSCNRSLESKRVA